MCDKCSLVGLCTKAPFPPLDSIRVMMIVWRLRGNMIRTAPCWIVRHNVHSPQHTYMSCSYRFSRLGLSHWDPYAVRWGGSLVLYYCNMVEWFWWDSSLISTTNWFPSVLWHCWFGHLACKNRPRNDLLCVEWDVKPYTLTHSRTKDCKSLCASVTIYVTVDDPECEFSFLTRVTLKSESNQKWICQLVHTS